MKNKFTNGAVEAGQVESLKRIELTGVVAASLAETALNEINQLKSLMDAENNLLSAYFGLLHQNQLLLQRTLMVF